MLRKQTLARIAQSQHSKLPKNLGKLFSYLLVSTLFFSGSARLFAIAAYAADWGINGGISSGNPTLGQNLDINLNVSSSSDIQDAIVDVEIYDANNSKIFQEFYDHQSLSGSKPTSYQAHWTPSKEGTYQVRSGVFNNNWSNNYFWNNSVASFTVNNASSQQTTAPSGSYAASASVEVSENSAKIIASLTSPGSLSDAIVDIEVYDQNSQKAFQKFYEHQNFNAGETKKFPTDWNSVPAGNYQIKIGVFNNNWNTNYFWQGNIATFNFGTQNNPTPISSTGFKGEYWNLSDISNPSIPSRSSDLSRIDNEINFDWQSGSPDAKISSDQFIARWVKSQNFDAGTYRFTTVSDDGVRLWIDNNLIIDQWSDHASQTNTASVQLNAGVHAIKMEYYENGGGAVAKLNFTKADTIAPAPTTTPSSSNMGGNYTVGQDGRIYKNGQKITLNGVSWFGAEGGAHVPHGLWTRNWKDMISQMKNSGFNAVRLPYCPGTLKNVDISAVDYSQNPDLQGLKSLDVLDKIVNELNGRQMFIQLDDHNPDCNAQSDLWYTGNYSEQQWIQDQVFLASRYKNLEYFIGLDLKNEPKGAATWGTGNSATDWNTAAEKAGRAALAANPNILMFVQGVENNPTCSDNSLGHWWGGNLEPQRCTPLKLPADKTVFTPHVYGPDVFNQGYFNTSDFPSNMPAMWEKNFGYLKDQGKAITIGEYGGKYGHGGDSKDPVWQKAFVNYLTSKGICDNFYWSWNPNSGDTGGVLQDDWNSVWQDKLDLLHNYANQCR